MAVHDRVLRPDSVRTTVATTKCTKGGCKLDGRRRMPGAGLSQRPPRKAPLGLPALQPYWGKLAVRNDRGDRGNVGIIRSPVRASILPDRLSDISTGFCSDARPCIHAKSCYTQPLIPLGWLRRYGRYRGAERNVTP